MEKSGPTFDKRSRTGMEARHFSSSADQISQAFGIVAVPHASGFTQTAGVAPFAPDIEEDTTCL
jgi:hypothetical protein